MLHCFAVCRLFTKVSHLYGRQYFHDYEQRQKKYKAKQEHKNKMLNKYYTETTIAVFAYASFIPTIEKYKKETLLVRAHKKYNTQQAIYEFVYNICTQKEAH